MVGSVEARCSRPLTLRVCGGCLRFMGKPVVENMAVVPTTFSRGWGVRVVRGRARGNIHLQKSTKRTRPLTRPRTAGDEGSSRCSRASMNTCGGLSPPASGGSAPHALPRGGSCWSSSAEGASSSRKIGCIDVPRSEPAQVVGIRALTRHGPAARKRRQRVRCDEVAASRTSCGPYPTAQRESAQPRAWQSIGPKPASCRQARGCWRLDDREVVRRRHPDRDWRTCQNPGTVSKSNAGGFTHGGSAGSLQRWCLARVLVT
jgi:hypothetical protein